MAEGDLSLVVLAAGRGTRFGGPKQLVPVRDDGATITDVLIERAAQAGMTRAVVVVSEATEEAMSKHLASRFSRAQVVRQAGARGTAQALLAARNVTDGPVLAMNADDIYPPEAFKVAAAHVTAAHPSTHAVIGFKLAETMYGNRPQSRALLATKHGHLVGIREGQVAVVPNLTFIPKADEPPGSLVGNELVSMNAMVLQREIFDHLALALDLSEADEVYLPDVLASLVADGVPVRVLPCDGRCHGLTYPDDAPSLAALL